MTRSPGQLRDPSLVHSPIVRAAVAGTAPPAPVGALNLPAADGRPAHRRMEPGRGRTSGNDSDASVTGLASGMLHDRMPPRRRQRSIDRSGLRAGARWARRGTDLVLGPGTHSPVLLSHGWADRPMRVRHSGLAGCLRTLGPGPVESRDTSAAPGHRRWRVQGAPQDRGRLGRMRRSSGRAVRTPGTRSRRTGRAGPSSRTCRPTSWAPRRRTPRRPAATTWRPCRRGTPGCPPWWRTRRA